MRLLVTGGAGFIGSNFVHYWIERHPDDHVVVYDLLTYAGNRASLAGADDRIVFVQGDIADFDLASKVLAEEEIDTVVNFAAESHNSLAVLDPGLFARTNVLGTQLLLEAARRAEVGRFHHISTCEVFGDLALDSEEVFTEESPYRPRTPYNASKAAADHYVRAYHETFGVPVTITNCANNYGPYQFPEKVLPLFITNALDDRPLPMYASTQNRREWLHVLDHCSAIPARRLQARRRARLEGRARLARRCRRHGRVVRGEPLVVGAASRAGSGRRDRLALEPFRVTLRGSRSVCGCRENTLLTLSR
jgi:dTDP-glucose 4,6-dehydratase